MKSRGPVFEKSRSVADVQHMRLMALLDELVRDKGVMKATRALGVDYKTLTSSMKSGRLSRRMRRALERALLEGGGSPAAEQRERNDALEERLEDVAERVEGFEQSVNKALVAVRGDVKALRDAHALRLEKLERVRAGPDDVKEEPRGGQQKKGKARLRREYPDLVTLDPADDDEAVFGEAWALIDEWRELKATHPNEGGGLDWLRAEERLLTVELTLLQEHGMTLPPETYPLRGFTRSGQVNWRKTALCDTRRALRKREILWRVVRALTLGRWRR